MTRALVGVALGLVALWLGVWAWARLPSVAPLTDEERAALMRALRSGEVRGLERNFAGPLIVTAYDGGRPVQRVRTDGPRLADAVAQAARALGKTHLPEGARLEADVVLARAPLLTWPEALLAVGFDPGVDGVGAEGGGQEALLTASDLLADDLLSAHAPLPGMEFTLGADTRSILRRLESELGLPRRKWTRAFRFRADISVEPADAAARARTPSFRVWRGNPVPATGQARALTKEALHAAAVAGGRYLLGHQRFDGTFDYEYWVGRDQVVSGPYSLPRHAGAAWLFAQLYNATKEPAFLDGSRRALGWLWAEEPPGCDRASEGLECVGEHEDATVDLGAAALATIALAELMRVSPEERAAGEARARRLARFILSMQKPGGDFCHLYTPQTGTRDEKQKLLYYSGEAAFALARLLSVPGLKPDEAWAPALDRALDYLTGEQYANLAGQFFFLEDHWTCMAADAGWDQLPDEHRRRYARFCGEFVAFLGRTQYRPGESIVAAQPDFAGAYGFSPLLPPHGTPVGSRSETTLSTLGLQERSGAPAEVRARTRAQLEAGLRFLLAHQLDDDDAWLMPEPGRARGGFLMSDVTRYIRIDFVQHACSAMLRSETLF